MAANLLKMETFVKEEMVLHFILLIIQSDITVLEDVRMLSLCFYNAGRGVDLNRNWSVDWGKKEKVISVY